MAMKLLILLLLTAPWISAQVPRNCTQAVVGIASDWNSSQVTLRVYEKRGRHWKPAGASWKGRLGRNGLAWGHGVHPLQANATPGKVEGDKRTPAGIFKIGGAYGYAPEIKRNPHLRYHHVTPRDLWVEDPTSPHYNRHLTLDHNPKAGWEKKAQMRQDDHAHSLKLYIAHNDAVLGGRPVPGLGSAIFFHIWRGGGSKATVGCTTMHETQLKQLIARIDPARNPVYIVLPTAEYQQHRRDWKLP